jgi:hypothetical protein
MVSTFFFREEISCLARRRYIPTTQNYGYETLFIVSGAIAAVGARLIHRCSVTYFDFEFDYLRKKAST